MKFKCDENLPQEVTTLLQQNNFDALSIHDQDMVGEADANIAIVCHAEERTIVTLDRAFEHETLEHRLWIVDEERIRIRS